jgi:serine acetyltransferase
MAVIRRLIKIIVMGVFYLLVLPFGMASKFGYLVLKTTYIFDFFAQAFSLIPGMIGSYARACFYHQTLKKSYLDLDSCFGSFVSKIETTIGRKAAIGVRTTIGLADIGDGTIVANNVTVLSGRRQHNFDNTSESILSGPNSFERIKIGRNCFVGDHTTVMANIEDHSIIGAGSVVVKDIPENVVAVGNPARVIKQR